MARRGDFDRGKESYWRCKLGEQADSGLTISAYCRREGISANSFFRWRRVLAERGDCRQPEARAPIAGSVSTGLFAPVSVRSSFEDPPSTSDACKIDMVFPSGHVLRVRPGFDSDTLVRLLDLLDSSRC